MSSMRAEIWMKSWPGSMLERLVSMEGVCVAGSFGLGDERSRKLDLY